MIRHAFHPAVVAAASAIALAATLPVLSKAQDAWRWLSAQDDPAALTRLNLASSDLADRWNRAFTLALDQEDLDLAESLVALAQAQGIVPEAAAMARYEAAMTPTAIAKRQAGQFYAGAILGKAQDPAGLAGALAADLTGLGDVRDLVQEGRRIARGEDHDELVLGLAALGLAATGATIASLGLAAPARGGVTTLKVAARAGRISPPLRHHLTRIAHDVIDRDQAAIAARAASSLDYRSMRTALAASVRPAALRELTEMAGDVLHVTTRAGFRSAQDALGLARNPNDLRRLARLAEARGNSTRAVLKLFGRGAFVLLVGATTLASWIMAGVAWLFGVLLFLTFLTRRVALFIARHIPP